MAWKNVSSMDERFRFVLEAQLGLFTITDLCHRYGISRKTGYKWLNRFAKQGFDGLRERSRRARHCPHRTGTKMVEQILEQRKQYPRWGPKKIAELLETAGVADVPAPSTIGSILKRYGMVRPRRRRRNAVGRWPKSLTKPTEANHVWAVDFKGWFRTGDGKRCDPLTASDLHSRYVLCCQALNGQTVAVARPAFEHVFSTYGLPKIIRTDNGAPFGSTGPQGMTELSMWWIQLGIRVEFIKPGHPEQNSIHERMHRTLKDDTCCPPRWNRRTQQRCFDQWRDEFNNLRPHESSAMRRPGQLYSASARTYPGRIKPFRYPGYYEVRRVKTAGQIMLNGKARFVGHAFKGIHVGLEPIRSSQFLVHAGPLVLGMLPVDGTRPLQPTVRQKDENAVVET